MRMKNSLGTLRLFQVQLSHGYDEGITCSERNSPPAGNSRQNFEWHFALAGAWRICILQNTDTLMHRCVSASNASVPSKFWLLLPARGFRHTLRTYTS